MNKLVKRLLLPVLIVAVGAVSARFIMARSKTVKPGAPAAAPVAVEVASVSAKPTPAVIETTGVVSPAHEVDVVPEVGGRIVWRAEALMPGGTFAKGQVLARIDPRDYALAIKQARSQVRKAELDLQIELGRQGIAKREWALLGGQGGEAEADLALRKPHLAAAQHNLEAAQSGLDSAALALERTTIRAPFNASVVEEYVEIGQVVGPGNRIARLIGTDRFWVKVSVPVETLSLIAVPRSGDGQSPGSKAVVTQVLGDDKRITRTGTVLRLISQLDPQSRRAQLIVGVDAPLTHADSGTDALPLLPGAFVDVEIHGRSMPVYGLPRHAVRDGTRTWVVDQDTRLVSRTVQVRWGTSERVFVTGGLSEGDRVVTSPLAVPVEGMDVKVVENLTVGAAR